MSSIPKIPAGCEGVIPHLVCEGAARAVEFYKQAFGAVEEFRMAAPGGEKIMHAAMRLGSSKFFLVDDFPEFCEGKSESPKSLNGTPVTLHRYVEDCDAAIAQAVAAGAKVVMPAMDAFWGDRYGVIEDPFGHKWSLATHQKDLTPEQTASAMNEAFSQG